MTTEIDENKINIDYSLFSWPEYGSFMEFVQRIFMNPFWCVDDNFLQIMHSLTHNDNAKLLEHSLNTIDEKYKHIRQIHLHNFYLQEVHKFNKIFKLYNIHYENYIHKIKMLEEKYGTYNEDVKTYLIVNDTEESKKFGLEKQKLENTLAVTEFDKVNPNLYLVEINVALFKIKPGKDYLTTILCTGQGLGPEYHDDINRYPSYRKNPLLMYKQISDIFDMEKIQNLKINYDLINEHFKNY